MNVKFGIKLCKMIIRHLQQMDGEFQEVAKAIIVRVKAFI